MRIHNILGEANDGRSLISWVVAGILLFIWYWVGHEWTYLQDIPRGDWKPVWILFTLVIIVICCCRKVAAGANVGESVINRIKGMVAHLIGLILAILVGQTIWTIIHGGFDINEYIQAIVVAVGCAVTTSAWIGAVEDATKP